MKGVCNTKLDYRVIKPLPIKASSSCLPVLLIAKGCTCMIVLRYSILIINLGNLMLTAASTVLLIKKKKRTWFCLCSQNCGQRWDCIYYRDKQTHIPDGHCTRVVLNQSFQLNLSVAKNKRNIYNKCLFLYFLGSYKTYFSGLWSTSCSNPGKSVLSFKVAPHSILLWSLLP